MSVQTIYESKWYRKNRPSREECETNPTYIKLKFLRQNLARAANRETPQYINVTLDYLLEVGESQEWLDPFTGEPLEFVRGGDWGMKNAYDDTRASNPSSCSIDRIDSDKGYVNGNIQLVTARTNLTKGTMTNQEFIDYCSRVVKRCC
jgi:hypothetical protein